MRMRNISLAILAAAVLLPCAINQKIDAQSMPAGQVTARMRSSLNTPEAMVPVVIPSFADLVQTTAGGQGGAQAASSSGTSLVSPQLFEQFSRAINDTALTLNLKDQDKSQLQTTLNQQFAAANVPTACSVDLTSDIKMSSSALGTASKDAWAEVIKLDNAIPPADQTTIKAAREVACSITDALDLKQAFQVVQASLANVKKMPGVSDADKGKITDGITAIGNNRDIAHGKNANPFCWETTVSDPGDQSQRSAAEAASKSKTTATVIYNRPIGLPLFHKGCHDDAQILAYFAASHKADAANSVQYLYNAQQSASAITGDLITSTFEPGIQAILAGTATVGSGTSSTTTSGSSATRFGTKAFADASSSSATSTDTVDTTLAKLQNGGDFNLRVPVPLLFAHNDNWSIAANTSPNVGFALNKFGGQQTITEATEYSANFPAEFYAQAGSVKDPSGDSVAAVGFFDARVSGEWISSVLAHKLGTASSTFFPIVQIAGGIEFEQKFRISLQYIYSTPEFCQVSGGASCSSSGSGSTGTTSSAKINGFHLAVSFSPRKSKSKSSSN